MSRVDEAMRRAAEREEETGATVGVEASPEEAALPAEDAADLAREPFPIELPERRRHPRTTPPPHLVRYTTGHAEPHPAVPPAEASPAAEPQSTLLERIDQSLAQKVVIDQNMMSSSREQYRRLAATLHHSQSASGLKVVMIASAAPGEGKTLTVANLGLTFSESYHRNVLLIDADLRRPALHKVFGTDNASGLMDGLMAATERKLPVRQVSERLALLQAGQPSSDPMAGLTSDRMRRLIAEARERFDWIIIDTPPVALLPDANLLAAMVDGAVMVVKAGSTSYEMVKRAVDAIGRQRVIGVVLNRAESAPHTYGYGYYYSHGYYEGSATARQDS